MYSYLPAVSVEEAPAIQKEDALSVSPNPFNPELQIRFILNTAKHVRLEIFNVLGKSVKTLFAGKKAAGPYALSWNGRDNAGLQLSSGVYIIRLSSPGLCAMKRVELLR
jgi:hypothetical protein